VCAPPEQFSCESTYKHKDAKRDQPSQAGLKTIRRLAILPVDKARQAANETSEDAKNDEQKQGRYSLGHVRKSGCCVEGTSWIRARFG
jgi:hypothetical protein